MKWRLLRIHEVKASCDEEEHLPPERGRLLKPSPVLGGFVDYNTQALRSLEATLGMDGSVEVQLLWSPK